MTGKYRLLPEERIKEFIAEITIDKIKGIVLGAQIKEIKNNVFKINVNLDVDNDLLISDWNICVTPAFSPRFNWSPHLTPTDRHIVSQHSFRSPSLIVSDTSRYLAIVPDLDLIRANSVKWYLDMDAEKNKLFLGISDYQVDGHVLYLKKPGTVVPKGRLKIGFYLIISEHREDLSNPWRKVLSFMWETWGRRLYESGDPIKGPLDCYVHRTYDWAFSKWGKKVWQEFTINGKLVGAPCLIVNVTHSPNYKGEINERETCSIWNQAWFSSLRSAQGLYRYGRHTKRNDLIRKALLTKELALSAPRNQGFFPSVIATEMMQVKIGGKTVSRSKGWGTCYWGNSNRNPFSRGDIKSAPYHVLDMSWTALLMLQWFDELEADSRLKDYAFEFAESLVKIQDEKGFFPAWLDCRTLKPMGILDDSPETSMSVTFLLKAYRAFGDEKYLRSALKGMDAIIENIIPEGRWEDFETYWSCCSYGRNDLVGKKVKRNNMYKQCNFSIYWTAEALYHCYKITSEKKYLKLGQRCLDEMLMTQASWQPPYMHINTFGGFGVMNCDGEWNDARQSLFSELIINYGRELKITEYIQRGLAALKASFIMMYCPENAKTKEQWEKRWPFFNEKDYGFMMENYGHDGVINDNGLGIGEFTIYDWGNGSASEAYMRILDHLGDDFINNKGYNSGIKKTKVSTQ
jgi:hypothetical protein